MVFSSATFLILFLPTFLVFYFNPFIKSITYKNIILLVFSLIFYAWGEPTFIAILMLSIIINWLIGINLSRSCSPRKWLVISIIWNIGLLFIFKYLTFSCNIINTLFHTSKTIWLTLPIGISFFTFQILSYTIDLYRKLIPVQNNPYKLALYTIMFPQLIAGPIVRYETIAYQIDNRQSTKADITCGLIRFIKGLSKKILLADYLSVIADNMRYLSDTTSISVLSAWIGAIAYAMQLYFDFSGYSDMAIGLGQIIGFHFEENFNYPILAKSISDIWRRWHISLTSWFRDYIYIPLGGGAKYSSRIKAIRNAFIVWLITGLWHGANYTFILWGILWFILIQVERLLLSKIALPTVIRRIYTLTIWVIVFCLFSAQDVSSGIKYIGSLFGLGHRFVDNVALACLGNGGLQILGLGFFFSFPISRLTQKLRLSFNTMLTLTLIISCILLILCLSHVVGNNYSPFIYFNF